MFENEEIDRYSLQNALNKGDFFRAFDKVEDNLSFIDSNIKELTEYSYRIGSKADNKDKSAQIDKKILATGNVITIVYTYINDIKQYKYINRNEKNANIRKAKELENKYYSYKKTFEALVNKIKNQSLQIIDSARNSMRMSEGQNGEKQQHLQLINGTEYAKDIEDKEKQVNIIVQVTNQINDLSKQTAELVLETGEKINSIEENVNSMGMNIKNAVNHMEEAKKSNESSSGYTNIILYTVGGIVFLLILLTLIMPSN